jgi:hypothetical protein
MRTVKEQRAKAQHYRTLALSFSDERTIHALREVADELDAQATERERNLIMEEKAKTIRDRAYQLWQEAGEPHGLNDEHWLQAEREFGESQDARA